MSPLERAAEALAVQEGSSYPSAYIGTVLTVLEAIREPSDAMIDKFVELALRTSIAEEGGWKGYARNQWQAMLDAALAEVPAKAAPERMAEEPPESAERAIVQALQGAQWFLMDEITDDFDRAREVAKQVLPANSDGGFTATEWVTAKYAAAFKEGRFIMRWDFTPLAPGESVVFSFTEFSP